MAGTTTLGRRWSISNDELPVYRQQNHLSQPLVKDLGEGYSNIYSVDAGLNYIETEYMPCKDLAVISQMDHQESRLVVTLGLRGHSCFANQKGDDVFFNEGYTTITTFNATIGERQYEANKTIRQVRFSMNRNWLNRYFSVAKINSLFCKKTIQTISHKPITTQGMLLVHQLGSANVSSEMERLLFHGHATTLLASELSHLFSDQCRQTEKFSQKDKEIARRAREILYQEFNNPPSVEQLSRRAGTNQFKLKKLFHYFFNNTPYGVLLEIRMNKAYQLLKSTHCHVNTAADFVGYQYASNFSAAFIKYYGVLPKTISKKL